MLIVCLNNVQVFVTRSANSNNSNNFYNVNSNGDWNNFNANCTFGVAPDFYDKVEQVKEKCFIYNFLYCF